LELPGVGGWIPLFMSTDAHFWLKIGFKFQSVGKISNISTSAPSSFRSIPTLALQRLSSHCLYTHVYHMVSQYDDGQWAATCCNLRRSDPVASSMSRLVACYNIRAWSSRFDARRPHTSRHLPPPPPASYCYRPILVPSTSPIEHVYLW